ncbi:hypothetical protein VaNZ11_010085, partial [Volvox africanus]
MTDSDLNSVPVHAVQHFTLRTCGGDVELNLSPFLDWRQDEEIIEFIHNLSTAAGDAVAVDAFRLLLEETEVHLRSLLSEPDRDCVEAQDAVPRVGVPLAAAAAAAAAAAVGDLAAAANGADPAMVPGQKTSAPHYCTVRGDPEGDLDLDPNTTAFEYGYGINTGGDNGGVVGGHGKWNGNVCNPCRTTEPLGSSFSSSSSSAAALLELCWEKLHLGYWKDVPLTWRNGYSLSCLVDVILRLLLGMETGHQKDDLDLDLDPNADSRSAGDSERRGEATVTVPPIYATKRPREQRQQWERQWRRQRPSSRQLPLALLQHCLRQLDLGLMMGGPLWRRQMHKLVEDLHAAAVEAAPPRTMQDQVAAAAARKVDKRDSTSGGDVAVRDRRDGGPGSGEEGGGSCSVLGNRSTKRLRGTLEL